MNVVGINGSHRTEGNTQYLVHKALEVCADNGLEIKQIDLNLLDIGFCKDCNICNEDYSCSIGDDCMDILEVLGSADAIIAASPTYFGGISGRLRTLFDRTLPLRRNNMMLAGKIGGAIAVGGSRNGGQEYTVQQIHAWMLIHEMIVVGDAKTAHFGGIATGRDPGDVSNDQTGMKTVINLAEKIVKTLKD